MDLDSIPLGKDCILHMSVTKRHFTRSANFIGETVRAGGINDENQDIEREITPRFVSPEALDIFKHSKYDSANKDHDRIPLKVQKERTIGATTNNGNYTYNVGEEKSPSSDNDFNLRLNEDYQNKFHRISIGDWSFIDTIGQGSMGKVKLAENMKTNEVVAVKVVNRALKVFLIKQKSLSQPRTKRELYEREKKLQKEVSRDQRTIREAALGQIMNHPNICKLHDLYILSNHYYLMFEYISGGQLLDYIIQNGLLKEQKAQEFSRTIASVLNYLHQNNIVHRDLKIENIMIDKNGELKVIDFGLSNFYSPRSLLKTYCGSLYFAAPELLKATPYIGPEIDIWSFGVVIYVLVCGKVPFDDENSNLLHEKIKRGKVTYPDFISSEAKSLLKKMLIVDPIERASLKEVMSHKWLTKQFSEPIESYLPLRVPLTRDSLDMSIIEEMLRLELIENVEDSKRLLLDLISERNYIELSKEHWKILNSYNSSLVFHNEFPTTAYHPLLSKYYLTSEMLLHKQKIHERERNKSVQDQSLYSYQSDLKQSVNHGTSSLVNDVQSNYNTEGFLPFKLKKTSEPHVSPTRKTHFDPSVDYVSDNNNEDKNINKINKFENKKNRESNKDKHKIGRLFRRLSLSLHNRNGYSQNTQESMDSKMTSKHTRAFSDLPKTNISTGNKMCAKIDIEKKPKTGISQHTNTKQFNNNAVRSKSVGNDRHLQLLNVSRSNNHDPKNSDEILEEEVLSRALIAPPGSIPSIEYPGSLFINGLFSVQTTSSKPLPIVRYKIIKALNDLHINFQEVRGGFNCIITLNTEIVNTNISNSDVSSPINDRTENNPIIDIVDTRSHSSSSSTSIEHLNHTSDTLHQSIPEFRVEQKENNNSIRHDNTMTPLSPISPVTTDFSPINIGRTVSSSKQETMSSSPLSSRLKWNIIPLSTIERGDHVIKFEVDIVKIRFLGLAGIHLKKISGDSWLYKEIAAELIKKMKL